ncbi:aldo/keto reductase [Pseudogracilibacillus sp. SO10305]|uniref:aldo/keto reductase n=1 Tax=Pseudogracilibacillus sp. SO10305 TaxID=3098292 RepID=UPI00300E05C6
MQLNIPTLTLNDGLTIPSIGLGTFLLKGEEGVKSIHNAIDCGYRLLDSAYNYENEGTLGEAIKNSNISRDQLRVTSKLPGRYHEYNLALETIHESLYRSGLDYFDLYLIHWPNPITNKYMDAWHALIDAKEEGLIRSIGVCNFLPEHIERLYEETGVYPSLNQIELHPYYNQEKLRAWNTEHGIITQSWSPLGRLNGSMEEKVVKELARKYDKNEAQIILRWHFQLGCVTIPKSSNKLRQVENVNIFDFKLTNEEMDKISLLSRVTGRNKNQDPAHYEEF